MPKVFAGPLLVFMKFRFLFEFDIGPVRLLSAVIVFSLDPPDGSLVPLAPASLASTKQASLISFC